MEGSRNSQAGPGPRSWAEDVSTYRTVRGSRSFNTIHDTKVPERFCRTNYVPFCDTRHPLFAYNDFVDGKDTLRVDPGTTATRYAKHGWGDVSLLREDGEGPDRSVIVSRGKARPPSPHGKDGRTNLYSILHMSEPGGADVWIGNPLVDPTKGKRAVTAAPDPKGRRDLFDVLHARAPGVPSDDCWLGNRLLDPAKGRKHPPGPEQLRGRQNLTEVLAMGVLHDPRRLELLAKGADPLGDAWCGHRLIDPAKGKRLLQSSPAAAEKLHGAVFRPDSYGSEPGMVHSDLPRRHCHPTPPPAPDTAAAVIKGQAGFEDDRGRLTKKCFPDLPAPNRFDGRRNLYAHMTYRPLSEGEQAKYGRAFDDTGIHGRRVLEVPGSDDPAKGRDMLAWRPEVRVGQFVPRGGLAQEARPKGRKLRGSSGR